MEFEQLSIGLVVQMDWDARPFRILAFDRAKFLYDCWWSHVGGWGLQNLRGKAYYQHSSCSRLRKHCDRCSIFGDFTIEWALSDSGTSTRGTRRCLCNLRMALALRARDRKMAPASHPISRPYAGEASSERFQSPISAVRVSGSRSRSLWAASSISAITLSVSAIACGAYCPRWR